MNQAIEKAFKNWLKQGVLSAMGGVVERQARMREIAIENRIALAFEGGHHAGAKLFQPAVEANLAMQARLVKIRGAVAEFSAQDYDEPKLQELLARLSSILNPEK